MGRRRIQNSLGKRVPEKRRVQYGIGERVPGKSKVQHNRGSATVEACVVVPLFLFFLLYISLLFMMIMADAHIHQSLAEAAIYGAQYGYLEDRLLKIKQDNGDVGETGSKAIINSILINKQFRSYLGDDKTVEKTVAGGKNGIIITAIPDGDNRKVFTARADYAFKITVPLLGSRYVKRTELIKQKAFLGYSSDESASNEDIYVYVTPNESVYHSSRSCTHLSLKVFSRSSTGGYPPCGFCGKDDLGRCVYIAESGRVYHNNPHCTGLKRTVSRVKLDSISGLSPCSRCGKYLKP